LHRPPPHKSHCGGSPTGVLVEALVAEGPIMLSPEIGKRAMSHYRIYTLFAGDRIARPTHIVTGDNDQEAIQLAKQLLDGRDLEVRQGARVVRRIKPTG
jgi:hypothetical protein